MKKLLILVLITCLAAPSLYAAIQGALYERFTTGPTGAAGADDMLTRDSADAVLTEIRDLMEGPTDAADNYQARLTAFLVPPTTGEYTFWVASDDQGRLWLSTDADPANAVRIAYHDSWTSSREWTKFGEQQSAPVTLEAGKQYWIRAGHAEGGGGDNLAVAWQGPGIAQEVIPGEYLLAHPFLVEQDDQELVAYESWIYTWTDNMLPLTFDLEAANPLLPDVFETGRAPKFTQAIKPQEDGFTLRETGVIRVEEATRLGFATNSDDGSLLWVRPLGSEDWSPLVVNNNGGHGGRYRSGVIDVEAGLLEIGVTMCEGTGGDALSVYYWTPDMERKELGVEELISAIRASVPSPANAAEDVPLDAVLTWEAPYGVENPTYKVYFGDVDATFGAPVAQGTDILSYDPELAVDGIYKWRVDVLDPNEGGTPIETTGITWSFAAVDSGITITEGLPAYTRGAEGEDLTLSVAAESLLEPLSYQWKKDGADLVGETGSTLVISALSAADEGTYSVVVSNAGSQATASTAVATKKQLAYYPLDADLADPTGAGPTGTFNATEPNAPAAFYEGVVGDALGINLDEELGEYVAFGAVGITGEMPRTIACWAKNSVPAYDGEGNLIIDDWCNIFGFSSTTGTAEQSFDFNKRGGQDQYCIHRYGAEWNMQQIDGEWHFLVGCFENDTVTWYVDGVFGGSATTNLQTQDILQLGKRAHSDALWRGWVDEARVYNYVLSQSEVVALYEESGMEVTEGSCLPGGERPEFDWDDNCIVDVGDLLLFVNDWMLDGAAQ